MNGDRRELLLYHARELIHRIQAYTGAGPEEFFADQKTQDAVLRNLEIIGQTVRDLDLEWLESQNPAVPWKQIAGMRNQLAHAYLGVEIDIIWRAIESDLPGLDKALADLSKKFGFKAFP